MRTVVHLLVAALAIPAYAHAEAPPSLEKLFAAARVGRMCEAAQLQQLEGAIQKETVDKTAIIVFSSCQSAWAAEAKKAGYSEQEIQTMLPKIKAKELPELRNRILKVVETPARPMKQNPAEISIIVGKIRTRGGSTVVPVEVHNNGPRDRNETGEQIRVTCGLYNGNELVGAEGTYVSVSVSKDIESHESFVIQEWRSDSQEAADVDGRKPGEIQS